MNNHNLVLEPFKGNKTRHVCPECNKRFEFARYINTETGEYIADHVGRCNRELNCGYHYTPKQFYQDNPIDSDFEKPMVMTKPKQKVMAPQKPVCYLPINLFEKSLSRYDQNHFYAFLLSLFGKLVTKQLLIHYSVGTSKHWPGANVFWQVDINGKLRQAKIMLYNPETGRRVKGDRDYVYFAGKTLLNDYDANLVQCFFGEALLSVYPSRTVAIVESEKTAMIASVYFPDLVWLATGGSHGCKWTSIEVCKVLQGRQVILFPDLGFFDKWQDKARQVMDLVNCRVAVSELLENSATEDQTKAGWDLADYLLINRDQTGWALTTEGYPVFWDYKITA